MQNTLPSLRTLLFSALAVVATHGATVDASSARIPSGTQIAAWGEVDPVSLLMDARDDLASVAPYLRRYDVPRLKMIILYVDRVLSALQDPARGLGHKDTMEAFMDVINALDAAEGFFAQISSNATRSALQQVVATKVVLAKAYGFDRTTYTLNLHRLLTQMKLLMDELKRQAISDGLRSRLNDLVPTLGFAIATAATGDRPKAFQSGESVASKVSSLYEEFNALSGSKDAFNIALTLQFLNERLLEYGQYD